MSEKMKIALLGVSHWHLPLYLPGLPENSVVGISDDNIGIAERYAGKYSCPAYQDYRQMVMETKPDFVFAFAPLPDERHCGISFKAGHPILNGKTSRHECWRGGILI